MKGIPLTTKILFVFLLIVAFRFVWTLNNSQSQTSISSTQQQQAHSKQKITTSPVEQILTCQQYKTQIRACTSQAMVCLQEINKSKQFHQENEQKINTCQALNEKNLLLNKDLRVKLDAVTERLDHLLKRKTGSASGKISGNEQNAEL